MRTIILMKFGFLDWTQVMFCENFPDRLMIVVRCSLFGKVVDG